MGAPSGAKTPVQVDERRKEIARVKEAVSAGFVAYMKEVIEGGAELWKESDLIALVETWEFTEGHRDSTGFTRLTSVWNTRRVDRGRGFGGIAIWLRDGLGLSVEVEFTDPRKHFCCLRLQNDGKSSFLVIVYFPPWKAPIYASYGCDKDPFLDITRCVSGLRERGPVWVLGDFNSRLGVLQSKSLPENGEPQWKRTEDDDMWRRESADEGHNHLSEYFLQFANVSGLSILNGCKVFQDTKWNTCSTAMGDSLVDYFLASSEARHRVTGFWLQPFMPESDHRPLCCNVSGFEKGKRKQRRESSPFPCREKREQYQQEVEAQLGEDIHSAETVVELVTDAARRIFTKEK
ncbi:hypothetical protein R1sor_027202 [Riccia sorocarpa]|uniref:Endonuclease/exonuclease/phosphatase domain-containing protein n=1 Tax=Riccia sorocarpa TaxID=122646 RepID=A0ABD3GJB0_9MARC